MFLTLEEMFSGFHQSMMVMGLSYTAFIMLRYISSTFTLWKVFFFLNHKWILNFVTRFFSAAIEIIKVPSFQYPREGFSWFAVSFALCPHMADRKRYLFFSPCKYSISIMGVPTSSVQFSYSIMSNSLQPHGLQETRLPCPAPTPGACSNCWVD